MSVVVIDNDGAIAVVEAFVSLFAAENTNFSARTLRVIPLGWSHRRFRRRFRHLMAFRAAVAAGRNN